MRGALPFERKSWNEIESDVAPELIREINGGRIVVTETGQTVLARCCAHVFRSCGLQS